MRRASPLVAPLVALLLAPAALAQEDKAPSDPKNFTWQLEGVFAVGGGGLTVAQVDWLAAQGFGAIADFRSEHDDPEDHIRERGIEFLDLPVDHAVDLNVTQLKQFVAWAKQMEAEGKPVYAHCTNGWHRAAAFAVAWEMERNDLTYDEAAKIVTARRPGTVMRAPSALLAYEDELSSREGLVVLLHSDVARPEPGGVMPVEVEVLKDGKAAPGAKVRVWSEESRLSFSGTANETGRYPFQYKAPLTAPMDHLYARASLAGSIDGADDVELFYKKEVPESLQLSVKAVVRGDRLEVSVTRDGKPTPARVIATADDGWMRFEETGTGRTSLPLPKDPADDVDVRVEAWGSLGATAVVERRAPEPVKPTPRPARDTEDAEREARDVHGTLPPPRVVTQPATPVAASPPTASQLPTARVSDAAAIRAGVVALGVLGLATALGAAWKAHGAFVRRH